MTGHTTRVVVEGQGTFVRVRKPAFWLYVGLVGFGLIHIGETLTGALRELSTALWIAILLNGVLAAVFIWILGRMDLFEREPAAVRAAAFIWGALVATSVSIIANNNLLALLTKLYGVPFATRWGPAIAGPLNEEWLKMLGVIAIVLIVREHFHHALDGLIYGAFCGLGFQVAENLTYAVNFALSNPNSDLAGSLSITITRILVAGPWSHPIYTGVAGLGVAFAVTSRRPATVRYLTAAALFLAAWAMHFLWNSPMPAWLPGGLNVLVTYGKGILILVFFLSLYRHAVRREWRWFTEIMQGQPETVITPEEMESMRNLRTRRKARKQAEFIYGTAGKKLVSRMQRAQVELSEALFRAQRSRQNPETALDIVVASMNVRGIREELEAARLPGVRQNMPSD
ncbi:RsiW-degrading membrane proteinase PrsW (M82 family) [Stackebrandtia albiflava]|uniref:RsiW-degrading membrane proteinase PrsW (M82 family) n=1 Tax=Stackebrandtia albiflava TaxID=406432 RepID=A0A562UQS4_9ACTN|nr:PrsW family intramembrane metalloprotease [Stackebrandtia albiflava]TWJ07957.1 RsiW-degrading membrane proteinase PrsW (M82 family) [Stackebrandtia albiflava]